MNMIKWQENTTTDRKREEMTITCKVAGKYCKEQYNKEFKLIMIRGGEISHGRLN